MKKLLLLALLLFPIAGLAETYQWTDQNGTVNFTEDLGKVPKKYRKKVKVMGGEEAVPHPAEVSAPQRTDVKVQNQGEKKTLFGGKDEKGWRTEFAQAKGELKLVEQDLEAYRARLSDTSKMSRTDYRNIQNAVKQEEFRVQELKKRLDSLTASADRAGVPTEFR